MQPPAEGVDIPQVHRIQKFAVSGGEGASL
jgi:hypothetical protein